MLEIDTSVCQEVESHVGSLRSEDLRCGVGWRSCQVVSVMIQMPDGPRSPIRCTVSSSGACHGFLLVCSHCTLRSLVNTRWYSIAVFIARSESDDCLHRGPIPPDPLTSNQRTLRPSKGLPTCAPLPSLMIARDVLQPTVGGVSLLERFLSP